MLEVDAIDVDHGPVACLKGISLRLDAGEIVTLIGSNGAGKTTTLRTISGLIRPKAGTIRFEGEAIHGLAPEAIVARGIVQVPEGRRVFPELTVADNLWAGGHLVRDRKKLSATLEEVFVRFPRLKVRHSQMAGTLSGGEQQMLAFGRAMMAQPRLLLLDEPSLGLAPIIVSDIMRIVVELKNAGVTILLVEQNAHIALTVADRGYVIETGEIVLSDTGSNLSRHPGVRASYLGLDPEKAA